MQTQNQSAPVHGNQVFDPQIEGTIFLAEFLKKRMISGISAEIGFEVSSIDYVAAPQGFIAVKGASG